MSTGQEKSGKLKNGLNWSGKVRKNGKYFDLVRKSQENQGSFLQTIFFEELMFFRKSKTSCTKHIFAKIIFSLYFNFLKGCSRWHKQLVYIIHHSFLIYLVWCCHGLPNPLSGPLTIQSPIYFAFCIFPIMVDHLKAILAIWMCKFQHFLQPMVAFLVIWVVCISKFLHP